MWKSRRKPFWPCCVSGRSEIATGSSKCNWKRILPGLIISLAALAIVFSLLDLKKFGQAIRQASLDPNIDCLMLYQITEYFAQFNAEFDWVDAVSREMAQIRQEAHKPLVAIIPPLEQENLDFIGRRQALIQNLRQDRIPVIPTVKRAAKVLYRLHQYGRFLNQGS